LQRLSDLAPWMLVGLNQKASNDEIRSHGRLLTFEGVERDVSGARTDKRTAHFQASAPVK
jgi:hypothetical protein